MILDADCKRYFQFPEYEIWAVSTVVDRTAAWADRQLTKGAALPRNVSREFLNHDPTDNSRRTTQTVRLYYGCSVVYKCACMVESCWNASYHVLVFALVVQNGVVLLGPSSSSCAMCIMEFTGPRDNTTTASRGRRSTSGLPLIGVASSIFWSSSLRAWKRRIYVSLLRWLCCSYLAMRH